MKQKDFLHHLNKAIQHLQMLEEAHNDAVDIAVAKERSDAQTRAVKITEIAGVEVRGVCLSDLKNPLFAAATEAAATADKKLPPVCSSVPTQGLTFNAALTHLKNGKCIARFGWHEGEFLLPIKRCADPNIKCDAVFIHTPFEIKPWQVQRIDLFERDWYVVPMETKPLDE